MPYLKLFSSQTLMWTIIFTTDVFAKLKQISKSLLRSSISSEFFFHSFR